MHMRVFCDYILVLAICFPLISSYHNKASCHEPNNSAEIYHTSYETYTLASSVDTHLLKSHEFLQAGSHEECCQTSSDNPADCKPVSVLPDKTKRIQRLSNAICPDTITDGCFQLLEKNFISKASNTINPTLTSLRTTILLV